MVCKRCRYHNSTGAKYCAGCGRKLSQKNQNNTNVLVSVAACVLIIAIGIGTLFIKADDAESKAGGKGLSENGSTGVTAQSMAAEVRQVLPIEDGSVAVLYADGTVRTSENSQFSEDVQNWKNVKQIYYNKVLDWRDGEWYEESSLVGLTESGSVLATDGSLSGWSNVKELLFTWQGAVGVTNDGCILVDRTWEDEISQTALAGMKNVETLVYSDIQSTFACLKKDGTVYLISENGYLDPYEIHWNNVKEVHDSGHSFYVIKMDGTVDGGVEDDQSGLNSAVKVVDYEDWLFGISADGRLLTYNGGNIYTNTGDMMVDIPGSPYYGGEVDINQFDQVADIVACWGLILLNKDGTVDAVGASPSWDLSDWNHIEKVYGTSDSDWENVTLYGIKQDGSVIATRYNWDRMIQTVTDQYRGWKLQDIYPGIGGVIGLTVDGTLVGDGIYENVDFSVFE